MEMVINNFIQFLHSVKSLHIYTFWLDSNPYKIMNWTKKFPISAHPLFLVHAKQTSQYHNRETEYLVTRSLCLFYNNSAF